MALISDYQRQALPEFDLLLFAEFGLDEVLEHEAAIRAGLAELRQEHGLLPFGETFERTELLDDKPSWLIPACTPPHDSLTLEPSESGCGLQVPNWGFLRQVRREDERFLAYVLDVIELLWSRLGAKRIAFGVSGGNGPASTWFEFSDRGAWEHEIVLYLVAFHSMSGSTLAETEVRSLLGGADAS
jgi:hypothetical protein